ncbi:MAG: biopolymer transporter ExbD [bacterium]
MATSQSDMTTIVVRKDQSVTVNGQSVTAGGLPQKLEAMGIKTTNPIFLQPEPGTPYSAVAKVVQLLQAAGYTNLAVVNNKPSGKKK